MIKALTMIATLVAACNACTSTSVPVYEEMVVQVCQLDEKAPAKRTHVAILQQGRVSSVYMGELEWKERSSASQPLATDSVLVEKPGDLRAVHIGHDVWRPPATISRQWSAWQAPDAHYQASDGYAMDKVQGRATALQQPDSNAKPAFKMRFKITPQVDHSKSNLSASEPAGTANCD